MKKKALTTSVSIYDKAYYLERMDGSEAFLEKKIESRFYNALEMTSVRSEMKILDVGTGRGEMAVLCCKNGATVYGIDYSKSSIEIAKKFAKTLLSQSQVKNIKFLIMNSKKLKFKDNYFDRIFFLDTLEHLYPEEAEKTLLEIKRVLKVEGQLILATGPNLFLSKLVHFFGNLVDGKQDLLSKKYHVNEQSFFMLNKLLKRIGFKTSIKIMHQKNWLYAQISNKDLNNKVKFLIKMINQIFDNKLFLSMRGSFLFAPFLCTHFICLCIKKK